MVTNAEAVLRLRQSDAYLQQIAAERFREFAKEELQSELEEYLIYHAKLQNGALDYYAVAVGYDHFGPTSEFHQDVVSVTVKDVGTGPQEKSWSPPVVAGLYAKLWITPTPYTTSETGDWQPFPPSDENFSNPSESLSSNENFTGLPYSFVGDNLGLFIRIQPFAEENGNPSLEIGGGFDPVRTVAGMFVGIGYEPEPSLVPVPAFLVNGVGGLISGFATGLEAHADIGVNFEEWGIRAGVYPTARTGFYNDDLFSQLNPGVRVEIDR